MNSNMVKPEKFDYLHLVYHFTIPLKLVSSIFLFSFFFSRNGSPKKIMNKKAFFILKVFKILYFPLLLFFLLLVIAREDDRI